MIDSDLSATTAAEIERLDRTPNQFGELVMLHHCWIMGPLHVALAADNGIDYLVTWNCKHIAIAKIRSMIVRFLPSRGYPSLVLCAPEALMVP